MFENHSNYTGTIGILHFYAKVFKLYFFAYVVTSQSLSYLTEMNHENIHNSLDPKDLSYDRRVVEDSKEPE